MFVSCESALGWKEGMFHFPKLVHVSNLKPKSLIDTYALR